MVGGFRRRARVRRPRARRDATVERADGGSVTSVALGEDARARRGEDAARRGRIPERFGDVDLARIVGGESRNRRRGAR